jgi:peptidoglycan/xylan/chitin deacetylase (PgdA/CDA1 family)
VTTSPPVDVRFDEAGSIEAQSRDRSGDLVRVAAKSVFSLADLLVGRMPGPRILIYHELTPVRGPQMCLDPHLFGRQLEWMADHGEIVSFEDALAEPQGDVLRFVLTFDDGYAGVFEHAFPTLRRRAIPFTLYITTGLVDRDGVGEHGLEPLGWDQVTEMMGSGLMTLGAHTHNHPDLRGLPVAQIETELDRSNEVITDRTGVHPKHFAYPKGYWSADAEPLVRERYETAVLGGGEAVTSSTDRHRICRVPVQRSDGMFFFKRKMLRGMRFEEMARAKAKGYVNPPSAAEGVGE